MTTPPAPPPEPPPPSRRVPSWAIALGAAALGGLAVVIALSLTSGDDAVSEDAATTSTRLELPEEVASTTSIASSDRPSSTAVPEDTSAIVPTTSLRPTTTISATTSSATETRTADPPTTSSATTTPPPPTTTEPFVWDPRLAMQRDSDTRVIAVWVTHDRIDHYTYRMDWESSDDSGGDFGTRPGDYEVLSWDVGCEADVSFDLVAWSAADEELGRASAVYVMPDCPIVPPSNLQAAAPAELAIITFRWEAGTGYDRHAWEVSITDIGNGGIGTSSETGTGGISVTGHHINTWDCGVRIEFTLLALMPDGTEAARLSTTHVTPDCPEMRVAIGSAFTTAAGTGNGRAAECPSGFTMVGGGFRTQPGSAEMPFPGWVYQNAPFGNGWLATIWAPPERDLWIQSYAVCVEGVTATTQTTRMDIAAGGLGSAVATCPPGYIPSGGGWTGPSGIPEVIVSMRDGNGWRVTAMNPEASAITVDAVARCMEVDRRLAIDTVSEFGSVPDGESTMVGLTCPAGRVASGGGFTTPDALVEMSYPAAIPDGIEWRTRAHNREFAVGGPAATVNASAVCLRFG